MLERIAGMFARIPTPMIYPLADLLAFVIGRMIGYRRAVIEENLKRSFSHLSDIERAAIRKAVYLNLADVLLEIVRGRAISERELSTRVEIEGLDALRDTLSEGRSALLLAVHQCNWEWLLLACSSALNSGHEPTDVQDKIWALYKPLHDPRVDRFMLETRSRFGVKPIVAKNIFSELLKAPRQARLIALVADQIPPREDDKHWAQFLDQPTAFYVGADKLARMTRSHVFFVSMHRVRRGRYRVDIEAIAKPPYKSGETRVMDEYVSRVEELVRQEPGNWLWPHRRWKYKKPLYG